MGVAANCTHAHGCLVMEAGTCGGAQAIYGHVYCTVAMLGLWAGGFLAAVAVVALGIKRGED